MDGEEVRREPLERRDEQLEEGRVRHEGDDYFDFVCVTIIHRARFNYGCCRHVWGINMPLQGPEKRDLGFRGQLRSLVVLVDLFDTAPRRW